MDIPADVQQFIQDIYCRGCGTPSGHGLSVKVRPEVGDVYSLSITCLRCGRSGYVRITSSQSHLSEATAAHGTDISSDEVIDLHEAMKADDWLAQLTKAK